METLGAMTMGGAVSDTIRKKIVNIEQFDAGNTTDGKFIKCCFVSSISRDIERIQNEHK